MSDATYVAEFLRALGRFGVKPGLERVQAILKRLGDPHKCYAVVHIAGSNGKGSTASFVAAGLQRSGLRTGLYTSPHLMRYNERMQIDGRQICDSDLRRLVDKVKPIVEEIAATDESPTEFDVGTAMAFLHFAEQGVDVAVIETGLGGRLDSTNVVDPLLSIITPITLDHRDILGPTLRDIAREKAGIIKPGRTVLIAPQPPDAEAVLLEKARECQAQLVRVVEESERGRDGDGSSVDGRVGARRETGAGDRVQDPPYTYTFKPLHWDGEGGQVTVLYSTDEQATYRIGMLGVHQLLNGAVAAAALRLLREQGLPVTEQAVRGALADTYVPGRLEVIRKTPLLILDGAHNELGAVQLVHTLKQTFAGRPITVVCGISIDKPADKILAAVVSVADRIITTEAASARLGVWQAEELRARLHALGFEKTAAVPRAADALRLAEAQTPPGGVICVMGSLYLVGEIRSHITAASSPSDVTPEAGDMSAEQSARA